MSKKYILFLFLLTLSLASVVGQDTGIKHYSSGEDGDLMHDYEGVACSKFIGYKKEIPKEDISSFKNDFSTGSNQLRVLSDNTRYLCNKTLGEWDYQEGAMYLVMCAEHEDADEVVVLLVTMKGPDSYSWWAVLIKESEEYLYNW